jgi:hypothetical protein
VIYFLEIAFQETRFEILVVVVKTLIFGLIPKVDFQCSRATYLEGRTSFPDADGKARFCATQIIKTSLLENRFLNE